MVKWILRMLYVARYNELEQLHMQVLLSCFFAQSIQILKGSQMTI